MRLDRIEKHRAIDGIAFTVGMALAFILYLLLVGTALASEKPVPPTNQTVNTNTSAYASPIVNAGGGQGGGASNQLAIGGDRSTTVALAHGAPGVPTCPNGLVPGRGKHRGHGSPLYSVSAVCDAPDEKQAAAMAEARVHELALARVGIETAEAIARRDRAALELVRGQTLACVEAASEIANRGFEACVQK